MAFRERTPLPPTFFHYQEEPDSSTSPDSMYHDGSREYPLPSPYYLRPRVTASQAPPSEPTLGTPIAFASWPSASSTYSTPPYYQPPYKYYYLQHPAAQPPEDAAMSRNPTAFSEGISGVGVGYLEHLIIDPAERRRIQNRIAQQDYRKRLMKRLEDLEQKYQLDLRDSPLGPQPSAREVLVKLLQNQVTRLSEIHSQRQLEIPGFVYMRNSTSRRTRSVKAAKACPDTGSSFDIMSESFAQANKLTIDSSMQEVYTLPNGDKRTFLGIVAASWTFEGSTKQYPRQFRVLADCVHDIIVGREFLKITETFSRFKHRVKEVFSKAVSAAPRLMLVDDLKAQPSTQFAGSLNGIPISGYPDTGSEICVIRRDFAEANGFKILQGSEYQTEVQFVDGSTTLTSGLVRDADWSFGKSGSGQTHRRDFHVMDDIPYDIILDKWLLWDNDVFGAHRRLQVEVGETLAAWRDSICLISLVKSKYYVPVERDESNEEAILRATERDRIEALPRGEQEAAWQVERHRQEQWEARQLQRASASTSTASTMPASQAASGQQQVQQRRRLFGLFR